jgi:putative peptidoglycan lipid II flippase
MSRPEGEYASIGKASLVVMGLTLLDKLLVLPKEMIIASRFGISPTLDVFNIALAFPTLVSLLFAGSINAALVPQYLRWRQGLSPGQADACAWALLRLALVAFAGLTALSYLLSPILIRLLGSNFDAGQIQLGVQLERLLVLLILFEGVASILTALIHARKRFFSLQFAPVYVNVAIIVILLWIGNEWGIHALVWGILLGTGLKVAHLSAALHRDGFGRTGAAVLWRTDLIPFFLGLVPLLASELLANLGAFIDQLMAAQLDAGSVSALRYACRISDLPVHIIVMAFAKALFPFISEKAARKDTEGLRRIFEESVLLLAFLTLPIIAGMTLLSKDLVAILFERGAFDHRATEITSQVLVFYSLGLFFYAYTFVNQAFFTALRDIRPLIRMGLLSVVMSIVFNTIFMHLMGVKGIALASSLKMGVLALVFVHMLKRRIGIEDFSKLLASCRMILVASGVMLGTGFLVRELLKTSGCPSFPLLLVVAAVMAACYLGMVRLFGTEQLTVLLRNAGRVLNGFRT